MIRDYVFHGLNILVRKAKIFSLKLRHGNKIDLKWNDKISWSVKIRINGDGKVVFGDNVEIRENVIINVSDGGLIEFGDRVFLNDGCMLNSRKKITIGADTMFGQAVKMYDHDHDYKSVNFKSDFKCGEICIGNRVWICSDSIILKGCSVGDDSVIAATTVLRECVEPKLLYYTKKTYRNRCVEKNNHC